MRSDLDDEVDDSQVLMPPPAKKQRQDQVVYKVGTVKKVKVHNFMTYAGTVTIKPGPSLNLVLGPNGTGKSSLVCALCIGLAGSPKRLGRADNLGDFVRRNCCECFTEITLSGGAGRQDVVIRRDIKLRYEVDEEGQRTRRYESSFQIDCVACTIKQVQERVAMFNIQFDNLCQFLPQDMVVEFARMNSYELLVATMKAMGDSQLEKDHQSLIAMRKQIKETAADVHRKGGRLQGLQAEHQEQHRDYERYAQRQRLEAEVKCIKYKLRWMEVMSNKKLLENAKQHHGTFKQAYEELLSEAGEDDGPIRKLEERQMSLTAAYQKEEGSLRNAEQQLQRLNCAIEGDKQKADDQLEKIQNLHKESERHKSDLVRLQGSVQSLKAELDRMPADSLTPELVERQRALRIEERDLNVSLQQKEEEGQDIRNKIVMLDPKLSSLNAELGNLRNVRLMRLRRLEQVTRKPGVGQTFEFVQRNRSLFKGPVYGPIGVEMDVKDTKWAPFIEKQCGSHFLNYCVTCKEDEEILTNFITRQHGYSFSIYVFQGNYHVPLPHPMGDASSFSEYGILHTLDQTFDAPGLIKHILAVNSRINKVYLGDERAQLASEELFAKTELRELFTLTQGRYNKISQSTSRYNKDAINTMYENVGPAKSLVAGQAGSEADANIAARQAEKAGLERELTALQASLTNASTAAGDLRAHLGAVSNSIQQIAHKKREIETLKARKETALGMEQNRLTQALRKPDPLAYQDRLQEQLQSLLDKTYQQAQQQVSMLADFWSKTKRVIAASLSVKEVEAQVAALKRSAREHEAELRRKRDEMHSWERKVAAAKQIYDRSRAEACQDYPRSPEMDERCAELSDEVDELKELQVQTAATAQAIVCNNENVIREYQARQAQIDNLTQEVTCMNKELDKRQAELDTLKAKWLPELQQLVAHINGNFSQSFETIACAGEVSLKEHEDFDQYAIEIKVKFRDGEGLQLLTGTRQSGGERSVSTILYLIALQEITWTPFRVVDEINQGMDPVNERKVFTQLVESSCQPDTPQCFLLTPKLLPGLPMADGITVLNIMNGPSIDEGVIVASNRHMGNLLYGRRWEQPRPSQPVAAN